MGKKKIVIFCKSYRNDLRRVAALTESVRRFNRDALPFYVSVPADDLDLFKGHIGATDIEWLCDEDIIGSNPAISREAYSSLPGHLSQQVVKAEFWRVNPAPSYFCIDSDSVFIRDFHESDFMASEDVPYTVLWEAKILYESWRAIGLESRIEDMKIGGGKIMEVFGRSHSGPSRIFGPFPVALHSAVWKDLEENYLAPRGMNIVDAIKFLPAEIAWYGEALLKYRSIDIVAREPFFKTYLYLEEYDHDRKAGITVDMLSKLYLGIVYQSNWYPKRLRFVKRQAYYFKKALKKFTKGNRS